MAHDDDKLIVEALEIVSPVLGLSASQQRELAGHLIGSPAESDPLTIAEHLKLASEHLRSAHAWFKQLHESGADVPSGVSGSDSVRALELAAEVDRLGQSVANYYPNPSGADRHGPDDR